MGVVEGFASSVLPYTLFLYAVSILTTMAGMEIFGWLTGILSVILIAVRQGGSLYQKLEINKGDYALFGFFLVVVVGAFFSPYEKADPLHIIGSVRWIFLFLLIRYALREVWTDSLYIIFLILVGINLIVSVYAIVQHFTGIDILRDSDRAVQLYGYRSGGTPFYRAAGMFSSPMTFGNSVGLFLCFPLAGFLLKSVTDRRFQKFQGIAAVFLILAAFATFTRGVWLGVVASLLAVSILAGWRGIKYVFLPTFLTGALAFTLIRDIRGRVLSIFNPEYQSNMERWQIWKTNFEMFLDNPIVGVGYGVNEQLIQRYYDATGVVNGMVGHAHSNLVQVLSGTGALGLIFFVFFGMYYLFVSAQLYLIIPKERAWDRALILGAIGAQVFIHVAGLTECNFKDAEVNHQFMFILAAITVLHRLYSSEHGLSIRRPRNERPIF